MFGRVYTLVTLAFFVFIVAFVFVRLRDEREQELVTARARFETLSDLVTDIYARADRASLAADLAPAVRTTPDLRLFLVQGSRAEVDYLWSREQSLGAGLLALGGTQLSAALSGTESLQLVTFAEAAPGDSPQDTSVAWAGAFEVLTATAVARVLREVLLILITFLGVTIVTLVILTLKRQVESAVGETTAVPDTGPPPKLDSGSGSRKVELDSGKPLVRGEGPSPAPDFKPTRGADGPTAPTAEESTGLFDPKIGLGFAKHFEPRLGLELDRAAANDDDISLIILRVDYDSEPDAEIARRILRFFEYQDLVFHLGDNTFAAVLPRRSLTEALTMGESFYAEFEAGSSERPLRLRMGVSSRNGRIVEGPRLAAEARAALARTAVEKVRIVGFHPDPQAYRRYLLKNRLAPAIVTGPEELADREA